MAETGLTLGSEDLVLIKASEFQASRLTYLGLCFFLYKKET